MSRDQHSDRRRVRQYVTVILQLAAESDSWETWDSDLEILNSVASSRAVRTLIMRPGLPLQERLDTLEGLVRNLLSSEGLALSRVLLEDVCSTCSQPSELNIFAEARRTDRSTG